MFGIKTKLKQYIDYYRALYYIYYNSIVLPHLRQRVRSKDKIKVLFLISELSPWKTENLYLSMLKHPRFSPILGLFTSPEIPSARNQLEKYCIEKRYDFTDLDLIDIKSLKADIIFYQKPYLDWGLYPKKMRIERNLYALFCYVAYSFHTMNVSWGYNQRLYKYAWQIYYENKKLIKDVKPFLLNRGRNVVATGLPIQDMLNIKPENVEDPWKDDKGRKRIIYAPHHTIADMHAEGIAYSTFLDYYDFMLEMAEKYKNEVFFAFKPHPILYKNLLKVWGKERADAYYDRWKSLENGQLETGTYTGLFMHSNAMIHDCSSFTIECQYTKNPVLYLIKDDHHADNLSIIARTAFDLHYKAKTREDIEQFIQNVINEDDPLKQDREKFFKDCLLPPHGKTACENIINSILGEVEYKKQK